MFQEVLLIFVATWFLLPCHALFFGLFNSKQIQEPDLLINETKHVDINKTTSANNLHAIRMYPTYTQAYFTPFQLYESQYPEYIQTYPTAHHQLHLIYYYIKPQYAFGPSQNEYVEEHTKANSHLQQPIVVLPIENLQEKSKGTENFLATSTNLITNAETIEYGLSKPQVPGTLFDLPTLSVIPDFRTGGYRTGPILSTLLK